MNRQDIIEFLQACLIVLDEGDRKKYPDFNPELWNMAEKLINHLEKMELVVVYEKT